MYRLKNKAHIVIIALCVLVTSCQSLPPDSSEFQFAPLLGVVYDGAARSVQGFEVFIDDRPAVVSDINGKFTIPLIAKGPHILVAKKSGYESVNLNFQFISRSQILYLTAYSIRDYVSAAEKALKQSDYLKAQEAILKALILDPKDVIARYMLASIRVLARNYDGGIAILKQLLTDNIREMSVYLLMIDIASLEPKYRDEVLTLVNSDPLFRLTPQINSAIKRISPAPDRTQEGHP